MELDSFTVQEIADMSPAFKYTLAKLTIEWSNGARGLFEIITTLYAETGINLDFSVHCPAFAFFNAVRPLNIKTFLRIIELQKVRTTALLFKGLFEELEKDLLEPNDPDDPPASIDKKYKDFIQSAMEMDAIFVAAASQGNHVWMEEIYVSEHDTGLLTNYAGALNAATFGGHFICMKKAHEWGCNVGVCLQIVALWFNYESCIYNPECKKLLRQWLGDKV